MSSTDNPLPDTGGTDAAAATTLRLVLIYAGFASLWILVSDELVGMMFSDPAAFLLASTVKGWLFVAVTSALLFALVYRLLDEARNAADQQRAAQIAQYRAGQLLDALANSSSDAIFAKDLDGNYLLLNKETARLIGRSVEEALGHGDLALFPTEQAALLAANDRRVIAENRINTFEESIHTADGERTYLATKGPLRDADGTVIGIFGISRDITGRYDDVRALRLQADALREHNEELDRFNRAAVGRELVLIDLKGQVNDLSRQLGRPPPYNLAFTAAAPAPAKDVAGDGVAP